MNRIDKLKQTIENIRSQDGVNGYSFNDDLAEGINELISKLSKAELILETISKVEFKHSDNAHFAFSVAENLKTMAANGLKLLRE